ncbi:metalloproteinase inhibitor 2-like [Syngnathoides biaculeatus]|uniref:metalloproteinase inhibitor 2-like n=1 Tax=Syngnathoides biaculeatus TaxID=300417 RepID=UPI002ADDD502|nr:metalloproteinase inhibitor 2-like [Syngnathoides biaculeatus]
MSWMVRSFALPFLLLCFRGPREGAHACSCVARHPQEVFCQADVVIKATVVGKTVISWKPSVFNFGFLNPGVLDSIKYDLKQTKMFKGPKKLFGAIYTGLNSAVCGVYLANGIEYLLMGRLQSDGSLHISSCDFSQPWDKLSATQKSLLKRYETGCDCKITRCTSLHCGIGGPMECLWTDFLPVRMAGGKQAQNFACIKKSSGYCSWYRPGSLPTNGFGFVKGR